MDEPPAVPFAPTDDDPVQRHRRDLLAALLVERFTPYSPPATDSSTRRGAV